MRGIFQWFCWNNQCALCSRKVAFYLGLDTRPTHSFHFAHSRNRLFGCTRLRLFVPQTSSFKLLSHSTSISTPSLGLPSSASTLKPSQLHLLFISFFLSSNHYCFYYFYYFFTLDVLHMIHSGIMLLCTALQLLCVTILSMKNSASLK